MDIKTNYMLDDWIKRCANFRIMSVELEDINPVFVEYIFGEVKTNTATDTTDHESNIIFRHSLDKLDTFSSGSVLPNHMLSLKKGPIVILLRNLDPKNWY